MSVWEFNLVTITLHWSFSLGSCLFVGLRGELVVDLYRDLDRVFMFFS